MRFRVAAIECGIDSKRDDCGESSFFFPYLERTQNPVRLKSSGGSSPPSGTKRSAARRMARPVPTAPTARSLSFTGAPNPARITT
jgi:hypothetical protein